MYEINMTALDTSVTDVIMQKVEARLEQDETNAVDVLPNAQVITINSGGRQRERLIGELRQIVTATADEELFKKVEDGEITKDEYNTQRHSIEFHRVK